MQIFRLITNLPKTLKNEHDGIGAFTKNAKKIFALEGSCGLIRAIFRTFRTTKRNATPNRDIYNNDGLLEKLVNITFSFSKKTTPSKEYFQQVFEQTKAEQKESVPLSNSCIQLAPEDPKIIAFYLPQFHPFPENDLWWGKGFTEWTNVSKAVPQFLGHYQPRLPGELGFYDLRLKEIQERQIQLAKQYGIYGFCYHHYWFAGKRLMEKPANRVINGEMRFPFCLCWANENWTRRWDGAEQDVLISQVHSPEDDLAFIKDITPALKNPNYIRIDNKPLLIVYKINLLPDAKTTAQRWREYCRMHGIGDIYLMASQAFKVSDPEKYGFDASVEFPPHKFYAPGLNHTVDFVNSEFKGRIFDYSYLAEQSENITDTTYHLYHTVIPSWDNEARVPSRGNIFHNAKPALYQKWLTNTCRHITEKPANKENYLFVNAWNEWAEGAYLEPDRRYGYAYLQATANAILTTRTLSELKPLISVIIPAYNHEQFIYEALLSVEQQTYKNLELIIVDDGSTDNTGYEIQRFIENNPKLRITYIQQENTGSSTAIDNGLKKSKGTLISILNSDDSYEPKRLESILRAMQQNNSCIGFSKVSFVDENGAEIQKNNQYVTDIREKIKQLDKQTNIIYNLLGSNIAVTSGNFLFAKWLYETIGGFSNHKLVHDWNFILEASFITKPIYVPMKLYKYRVHRTNTFNKLDNVSASETDSTLKNFFSKYKTNYTLFNSPFSQHEFNNFIHKKGYEKYLI